jgi:uncharacterized protein (DUF1330 family)
MMIYAMNLYDIIPGKEDMYREYVRRGSEFLAEIDAEQVAAGHHPGRGLKGKTRGHFVIMRFASIEEFDRAMAIMEEHDIHHLRENATENYIWTLFENWDMAAWLAEGETS